MLSRCHEVINSNIESKNLLHNQIQCFVAILKVASHFLFLSTLSLFFTNHDDKLFQSPRAHVQREKKSEMNNWYGHLRLLIAENDAERL